jgi:L-alanine-DL-glutamate epimerase-like enolase superfamily enzyme
MNAERIAAVRSNAPDADIIVDANGSWSVHNYLDSLNACVQAGVRMIEQPFAAGMDDILQTLPRPIPVCADESARDRKDLAALAGKYDAVNIKLDKAGGLTEGLALANSASAMNLDVMVGCVVATSLSMAPAMILAQRASVADLDGALLLAADRVPPVVYEGDLLVGFDAALWG